MIRQTMEHLADIVRNPRALIAATALGAVTLSGCGGTGLEEGVEACGNNGTPIVATYEGQPNYSKVTDPAVLANYSGTRDLVRDPSQNGVVWSKDYADKVGEVACKNKAGKVVLNTTGAKVQSFYLNAHSK